MTVLLLTILAHVIGDFILQTDNIAEEKRCLKTEGFIKHGLIILILTLVAVHFYKLKMMVIYSAIISFLHIIIDYLKEKGFTKFKKNIKIEKHVAFISIGILFVDQVLHLFLIFTLWKVIPFEINLLLTDFYSFLLSPMDLGNLFTVFSINKALFIAIVYLYIIYGGAIFIKLTINCIFPKNNDIIRERSNNVGKYIGVLERAIILTLIFFNSLEAVAIVVAAKSIARFGELNNKDFAEYYLVGTLLSVLIAIAGGILLNKTLTLFN